eukprot:CAMPEP_0113560914 /NCGR_PEP_ID=MMETSP0015_2-20120614/19698_1 /TAXON_ID=2838 /ORGANISM="Odontella" /LENGTH=86 /DNA_ID=CAMNT_0000462677 /DNA_START=205 /DNA_END=465 /DNA_ORIENTATION=+ /assembly_acc=CAM_ASM_000160
MSEKSTAAPRTVVRDPRKKKAKASAVVPQEQAVRQPQKANILKQPLPFVPSEQNQQAVGSTLGSYMLMGAGVSVGFALVGALLGGF